MREEAGRLEVDESVRQHLSDLSGTTLHRLLGRDPQSSTRFRHNRLDPLPHDVVIVDETSMVSLSMMARLVEAVRADARLIFLGDPEQLASVEAGAVLGDVVGPATLGLRMTRAARVRAGRPFRRSRSRRPIHRNSKVVHPRRSGTGSSCCAACTASGRRSHGSPNSVKMGDATAAFEVLRGDGAEVSWIVADAEDGRHPEHEGIRTSGARSLQDTSEIGPVRDAAVEAGRRVLRSARISDAVDAISALNSFRLLCAHRRGPAGALTWASHIERWMATGIEGFFPESDWYVGRPLLVTSNDYGLGLYNGDTGVVVDDEDGRRVAAFEQGGQVLTVSPSRLEAVETLYAMTVHKSQGSQFDTVALLLPGPDSPILTRELLYTAVTRAIRRVIVVGSEESVRSAVERPIARSSGLRRRLWGA